MSGHSSQLNFEVVRAGAGAGKTTNLICRVTEFSKSFREQEGRWPRLVVTTFTRKATQELRERLVIEACKSGDVELLNFIGSRSQLHISTLHGVFNLFLRRFGHLFGIDSGFTILSASNGRQLAKKILREIVIEKSSCQSLLETFSLERLCDLCIAYSHLASEHQDLRPSDEKTFERAYEKVSKQFAENLEAIVKSIQAEASSAKWLEYADKLLVVVDQLRSPFSPHHAADVLSALTACGKKPGFSEKNPPLSEETAKAVVKLRDKIKEDYQRPELQPENWKEMLAIYQQFDELAQEFNQRFFDEKKRQGRFELSDLEHLTLQVVRQEPALAKNFAQDFDFWLIDEYQDTSPLQVAILEHLVGDAKTYVVGDPQQSIYLFRGARSEVFRELENRVASTGGQLTSLMTNYRSRPELLYFLNDFFTKLSPAFSPMEPRSTEKINPQTVVAKFAQTDDTPESEAVYAHIVDLVRQGEIFENICILARTHNDLNEIARDLKERGLPTHIHSSAGFFARREVRDALALLKFLVNPHDNYNLIELLRSPWVRIEDQELVDWLSAKPKNYWLHFCQHHSSHPMVQLLTRWLKEVQEKGVLICFERALFETGMIDLSHAHDSTGRREANLWKLVVRLNEEARKPGFSLISFIDQAIVDQSEFDGDQDGEASAALEPDNINLMTIHASKGLKFKHVILVKAGKKPNSSRQNTLEHKFGLTDKGEWSFAIPMGEDETNTPSLVDRLYLQDLERREMEEFDRLLYVALTRAAESVMICYDNIDKSQSWIGRVRWDLSLGTHQCDHYTYVVCQGPWTKKALPRAQAEESTVRPKFGGGKPDHFWPTQFSVSRLLEETEKNMESEAPLSSSPKSDQILLRQLKKAVSGTLIHRAFEVLKYHPNFDFKPVLESWFGSEAEKMAAAIEYVKTCTEIPMLEILERGHVEWGFQLPNAKGLMEGQIDLWGQDKAGQTWIIDYKSGRPERKAQAFSQLELYSLAIRRLTGAKEIKLGVIYPLSAECYIKAAPPEEEICQRFGL